MSTVIEKISKIQNIIFIDVCPSINFIKDNAELAKSIIIIDHHKSGLDMITKNKELLKEYTNVTFIFDMKRSGCQLAWDYFFPDIERSWIVDYVGDRDLWNWKLENAREICSAIDYLCVLDENDLTKIDKLDIKDPDYDSKLTHLNNSFDLINIKIEKLKSYSYKQSELYDKDIPVLEKNKQIKDDELTVLESQYNEIKDKRIKAEQLLLKTNPYLYRKIVNSPLIGDISHNNIHGGLKLIQKAGFISNTEPTLQEILINSNIINKFAQNILST
jgi:hypothetical protein